VNTPPETEVPESARLARSGGQNEGPNTSDSPDQASWPKLTRAGNETRDWRIWLGLILTFTYLVIIGVYVSTVVGWWNFFSEPIELVGSFLEGAFAPLAFLWLVIGYFLQKKELMLNTQAISRQNDVIRQSAEQAVIQSRSIVASELHARKESFLKIAESVKQQLGAIMGFLYISSQSAAGGGLVPEEKISELWSAMSEKDPEIFSRQMLTVQLTHGERYSYKLFYGTPIRTRHINNFIFNFERLLRAAEECDTDGMIHDALLGTGNGYIYSRAVQFRDNPPAGFTPGVYDFDPDSFDDVGYEI
jgi:hypothetical protein